MKPNQQVKSADKTAHPDAKDSLRAFIAIEIPSWIRKTLELQTAGLQAQTGQAVRWVSFENMHLTLKFLGDFSPGNVEPLSRAIQSECSQQIPFEVIVNGLGSFPNPRRPRVIWIGLQAPPELGRLQHRLELVAARLGTPAEDRPFSAHLTIGRVREQASLPELQALQAALSGTQAGEYGRFSAQTVTLFKSELRPNGAFYTPLFTAQLGDYPRTAGNAKKDIN